MSGAECIDLSENDRNNKNNHESLRKHSLPSRPKTVALKCIGLSLLKMQYSDKFGRNLSNSSSENGIKKSATYPKTDIWKSVWLDNDNPYSSMYPLRHTLEYKYEKSCKCPLSRSVFCQSLPKMTRLNWIHHIRRGHVRIDHDWKRTLKRNHQSGIGSVFELFCVLCNKSRKSIPFTPNEFINHMKKLHPTFMPYNEYFSYFQRCFICNDETKSFTQNINHRQLCISAVNNNPNQIGTENFNNCFKTQYNKSIVSVELENDHSKSFNTKLKSYMFFKRTTLHYWLSRKRMNKSLHAQQNGNINKELSVNKSANKFLPNISQFIPTVPLSNNASVFESERVPPNSSLDITTNADRFFIPAPFQLRNDVLTKDIYHDWCKLIGPVNSRLPKVNPWYCELCNAMIRNVNTAYSHLRICHSGVLFADNYCKSCTKRFLTIQGYKLHFKDHKRCPVARKCGICGSSVSINEIYNHLFETHKNNFKKVLQLTTCLICRDTINNLVTHLFDVHGISNTFHTQPEVGVVNFKHTSFFNCTKCSFTFFSEVELRNHAISAQHHFECQKCPDKKFYLYWEFMNHKNVFHKKESSENNLVCEVCVDDVNDENEDLNQVKFCKPSAKIEHFLNKHNSNCCVVLTDLEMMDKSQA